MLVSKIKNNSYIACSLSFTVPMTLSTSNSREQMHSNLRAVSDKPSVCGTLFFMAIKKDYPVQNLIKGNSPITKQMEGKKFGRLTVLKYEGNRVSPKGFQMPMVMAKCDCGSTHLYIATKLRTGHSTSCGCFQSENSSRIHTKHGQKSPKHGKRGTILYSRWRSMFDRVRSMERYKDVLISERWQGDYGFENFCSDMGPMPTPKHTVDRYPISNGDYTPENTRWATMKEQAQNTTKNKNFTYKGEVLCMSEIARRNNLEPRELNRRINAMKLTLDEALSHTPRKTNKDKK